MRYLMNISKTDNFVMASKGLISQMSFTTKIVYHILAATDILISILKYEVTKPFTVYKHLYCVQYLTHLTVEMYPRLIFYDLLGIKLKRYDYQSMSTVINYRILDVYVSPHLSFQRKSFHSCSVLLTDELNFIARHSAVQRCNMISTTIHIDQITTRVFK